MSGPDRNRGLAPVVGKAFEVGIVVLYVAMLTASLYGNVVPEYRTVAGDAVADRTLAAAALSVENTIPTTAHRVDATAEITLPATIRGEPYRIRASGERLELLHPHPAVTGSVRLALPDRVRAVRGTWHSTEPMVARVTGNATHVLVELQEEAE